MSIITILTDFGIDNEFVGVMKGVIYGIAPEARIVDLTHKVPRHDIREGGIAIWRAYRYFPKNTVHIFVVDPGVGTRRRPIAARIGDQYFVGPDNGLLTYLFEDAEKNGDSIEVVHLQNNKYWLEKISRTFHGRDIFAPVGAHLSIGASLRDMGTVITDPARMQITRPIKTKNGWEAHISVIDGFGNMTLDLPASELNGRSDVRFRLKGVEVSGIVESYGHKSAGELVAVVDSEDYLEIAVVNGSAKEALNASVGDMVEVNFSE
jgi:S-adenosylmethionine hydrolase